ncbi:hypothetical protein EC912_101626 [Luteibacter rhizovicinus]|uniref:Uncharacterized protein n=1 Tax=Luteibacter rhizovicinus TaxID=242606 RepID=A0A4V2W4X8_9GAMM|nr:hypothetical protein [Luteibacter rhizovicinus]TCV97609.1 hypothetical protein EC912_101626 [Luteibacter rhizovicinus]
MLSSRAKNRSLPLETTPDFIAPLALPAPRIPSAEAHGGINLTDLANPTIAVLIGPYQSFDVGDTLEVLWDDPPVQVGKAPIEGHTTFATVPIASASIRRAGSGSKSCQYNFYRARFPAQPLPSPVIPIVVKIDAPGDPDIGGSDVNPKLLAPQVIPSTIDMAQATAGVDVIVPAWLNMAVGDKLTIFWGDKVKVAVDPAALIVGQPTTVHITEATIIEGQDNPALPVYYDIFDIVDNWSEFSLETPVNVSASTRLFDAPYLAEAPTGSLNVPDLGGRAGTAVVYVKQVGIVAGDTVTLFWNGLTSGNVPTPFPIPPQIVGTTPTLNFTVPNATLAALTQGSATFFYKVEGPGAVLKGTSGIASLNITGPVAGQLRLPIGPFWPAMDIAGRVVVSRLSDPSVVVIHTDADQPAWSEYRAWLKCTGAAGRTFESPKQDASPLVPINTYVTKAFIQNELALNNHLVTLTFVVEKKLDGSGRQESPATVATLA